jgi:hypothetical protein
MLKVLEDDLLAWAIIVPAAGFWASVVRAIASSARLLSRTQYPFKTFSTVEEGSAWLEQFATEPALSSAGETLSKLAESLTTDNVR